MASMDTIISTVLISAPLAFVLGWVVSKAVLGSESVTGIKQLIARKVREEEHTGADDRDAQIAELQQQLDKAEARILKSRKTFKTWRERIRPVARQFRQQRMIISELRDELRRRDAAARQVAEGSGQAEPLSPDSGVQARKPDQIPQQNHKAVPEDATLDIT